jgi:hypothetical protein
MRKLILALAAVLALSGAVVVAYEAPAQAGCPRHNPNC